MIKEKKTGEVYKSKAAMMKHEKGETKAQQKREGYMKGGAVGVSTKTVKVPQVVKAGSVKLK